MSGISLQPPVDQESGCSGREGCRCAGAGDGGEAAVFVDGGDPYAGGGELRFDLAGAGIAPAGMNVKAAVFGIVGADGDRQKRGGGVCDRSVRIGSQKNRLGGDETGDRKPELEVPIDIEAIFHPERPETGRGIGETDENGNLVDGNGNLIDWDGNRIDENGYLLNADGSYQIDENGEYIKSDNLDGAGDGSGLQEAVSDTSIPAPLDGDSKTAQDNDMESEGLTNEEAGLE